MTTRTAFYRWWITDEVTGKLRYTSYVMTEKEARARHPGMYADRTTLEWRDLPDSSDEWNPTGLGPKKP